MEFMEVKSCRLCRTGEVVCLFLLSLARLDITCSPYTFQVRIPAKNLRK
jgi:hypothetical protein